MTTVEHRSSGQRVLRYGLGRQPLLTPQTHKQEILWLSELDHVIRVLRHWDDERQCTEVCTCQGICTTQRTDRLIGVLAHTGANLWEERLLILPEDGWRTCERAWLAKFQDERDMQGAVCIIQRAGSRRNSRTTCIPQKWQKDDVPSGFPIGDAALRQMHIATDFFGLGCNDAEIDPSAEGVVKPRIALGKKQSG